MSEAEAKAADRERAAQIDAVIDEIAQLVPGELVQRLARAVMDGRLATYEYGLIRGQKHAGG